MQRTSGILMHISSLNGQEPIGTLGKEAYDWINFLSEAGQSLWQILPLGPTGYGNSPYQCFSAHAGNPFFISLTELAEEGLLKTQDLQAFNGLIKNKVDYEAVVLQKLPLLKKASQNFDYNQTDFLKFCSENSNWLDDYAYYRVIKSLHNELPWCEWEEPYRMRSEVALKNISEQYHSEINYYKFEQYCFFRQWKKVKDFANEKGIRIIGDIPIYVSYDSADTWVNRKYFLLDDDGFPEKVAGVPPDYFSETGQLWGNPVFNWDALEEDGFSWWLERIKSNLELFDIIRIDHFRGLSQFWAVPYGEKTAINGKWFDAPGHALFRTIEKEFGKIPIIAEDLGVITEDVIELRETFNLPGMKILQFAFDSAEANDFMPHTYTRNSVVYTGTHDNDTVVGWYNSAKEEDKELAREYMNVKEEEFINIDFIRTAWASVSDIAIAPMQDVLGLGSESRMNLPGTIGGNWEWRLEQNPYVLTNEAKLLRKLSKLYGRLNQEAGQKF